MAGSNSTSVTPGRKTVFTIDVEDEVLADPVFGLTKLAEEIDPPDASCLSGMRLIDGIGWILNPAANGVGSLNESTAGQVGQFGTGQLTIPSGFASNQRYRRKTELTGAYTGAGSDLVATTGMTMFGKLKDSAHDWDDPIFHLAADRTAFPPPAESEDLIYMDRVGVATSVINDVAREITFSYVMPVDIASNVGAIFTFYFNGPAGWDKNLRGWGQYAAKMFGDGRIQLFERGNLLPDLGNVVWRLRKEFQRGYKGYDPSGVNYLAVSCSADPQGRGAGPGGVIHLRDTQGATAQAGFAGLFENKIRQGLGANNLSYRVPKFGRGGAKPVHYVPIRADMRRAIRGVFGIAVQNYVTEGYITDGPFSFDFFPTEIADISVEVYGSIPSGTTMKPRLFRGDGDGTAPVELTLATEAPIGTIGYQRTFTPPAIGAGQIPLHSYYVRVDQASDGGTTPALVRYVVTRNGVSIISSVTPTLVPSTQVAGHLPGTKIYELAITGAEEDASQEQASLKVNDPLGVLSTTLGLRQGMPATISTQWDPLDATKTCVLFRGDVDRSVGRSRGRIGATYPSADWKQYDVTLVGPWKRLEEALVPHRFSWAIDPLAPTAADGSRPPYKVTDVLRTALSWGGFPSDRIDIPDIDLRLFPVSGGDSLYIETFAQVADFVRTLAKDYLGGALIYDPNAGTYGKWKLIYGVRAPYTNKAAFVSTGTGIAKTLQHVLASYPQTVIADSATQVGVTVPTCPILRDTSGSYPTGLEANIISVSGSGDFTPNGYRSRLTQTIIDPLSFDFFGIASSDPSTPDFLNRIRGAPAYIDPTLNTPEAVNWFARRIAQYVFTPTKVVYFEAPLLLVEHEDDATKRRPLRYGDPVLYKGVQLLVRNVNPKYDSDIKQLAYYELETPRVF